MASALIATIVLFLSTVYMGIEIGVNARLRTLRFAGGLLGSLLFAVLTWNTLLSFIGGLFFYITLCMGPYADLELGVTLFFSVIACLGTCFFLPLAKALHELTREWTNIMLSGWYVSVIR
jgi:small basic protein